VGEGVVLTQAGYLPPKIVEAVYDDLDLAERWLGKGNREDQTYPVLELREQAQALGCCARPRGRWRRRRRDGNSPTTRWGC